MLAVAVVTGVLTALTHNLTLSSVGPGLALLMAFVVVGLVVARHQPQNPIGWMLLAFVALTLLGHDAGLFAALHYRLGHRALSIAPVVVLFQPVWILGVALFALVILLFPDGRLPSGRWRWVLAAYFVLFAYVTASTFAPTLSAVIDHRVRLDSNGDVLTAAPTGIVAWISTAALVSIGVIWISFVVHQFLAWRSSSGERRQQFKWLLSGAAIALILGNLPSSAGSVGKAVQCLSILGLTALPIGIGIGILKYRLYEIDRLISRTLSYAIVTGLVVGVYVGVVTLVTKGLGFHTPVAVAASTLAAVALFNPLRLRVQRIVDRRFNRAHYDAELTVAAFTARLRDAVDLETVRTELLEVVNRAVEPAHASVWIRRRR
jgi:hypothetical protein